jgi:Flp pilus assembly protein TadB
MRNRKFILADLLIALLIIAPVLLAVYLSGHHHASVATAPRTLASATQASTYKMKPGVPLQAVLNTCLSEAAAAYGIAHGNTAAAQTASSALTQQYSTQRASCYQRFSS